MTCEAKAPWRRRLAILGAAAALLTSSLALAWADPQDDLEDAEDRLSEAKEELNHSSEELADATAALKKANAKLPAAEEKLAAAEEAIRKAQAALEAAEAAERKATAELERAIRKVEQQKVKIAEVSDQIEGKRESLSRVATSAYQRGGGGELAMITAAFQADTFSEFAAGIHASKTVLDSERSILDDLQDDRAALANERVVLEDLQDDAERLKEQAEIKVAETTARHDDATAAREAAVGAKAEVDDLIATRRAAMRDAEAAEEADAREYAKWKAERERIQEQIDAIERRRREQESRDDDGDSGSSSGSSSGSTSSDPLIYPVSPAYVTSPYGMRTHPITGVYKLHDGTDFRASCGTPIRASAGGTVEWATYQGGYGNQVAVSGGRYVTTYSHLSSFAVSAGSQVSQGQVIGYAGTTGYSTGCHLHFMLYVDGNMQNPMSYL